MRGLLEKSLRESWLLVALACVGLGLTMGLFVQILPQFEQSLTELIVQVPFIRTLLSGLMGMDVSEGLAPQMLLVVVWSHPVVLAIVWGFQIALCTRVPASEIERGTIDVLLGWPVSRTQVYLAEGIVWVGSGLLLLACGLLGFLVSAATLPAELEPELDRVLLTLANLLALYLALGGVVQCVAALCSRRGGAIGIALAVLLGSYLVQFLSTLWAPAERVAFLSLVHYYQPARVMLQGTLPLRDVLVLLATGSVLWAVGCVIWARRSVLTT
jgi:ABC-type transport system involved in multi-copper enzyme maturation permease subunit